MSSIFGGKPLIAAALALALTGCGGGGGGGDSSSGGSVTPPRPTVTIAFSASSITTAETSTLTWSSTGADECVGFDSWSGVKATSGSQSVSAGTAGTYTYTLSCTNAGGTTSSNASLTVTAAPVTPAPTVTISASPASITLGGASTITWSSSHASSCTATGDWSGSKTTSGSSSVVPGSTGSRSFGLTCTGAGGTASQSTTVTVTAPAAPTVSLGLSPTTITVGNNATLTWSSSGATSCTATGPATWAGSKATSGSLTVTSSVAGSYTYGLSCTNAGGTTSKSVTLTANAAAPTVSITLSPSTIRVGETASLAWSSTNATSCTASGPATWTGSKATSGTLNVTSSVAGSYTYSLSCTGSGGTASGSTTLTAEASAIPSSFTVSLLAGQTGGAGVLDGDLAAARFSSPNAIVKDSSGNYYVADATAHVIRKITTDGKVSTFVGEANVPGTADGTGKAARLRGPKGLAIDSSGNLFIGDTLNHCIRKVTPAGVVTTLAGSCGTSGTTDAVAGGDARFYEPMGLVVDPSGNVYVVDTRNFCVRKITPAGYVTLYAGKMRRTGSLPGEFGTALLNTPRGGIVRKADGTLYITDNHGIRYVDTSGYVDIYAGALSVSGSTDASAPTDARFFRPQGLHLDASGNLYVADAGNQKLRKVTAAGAVSTVAGKTLTIGATDGAAADATFNEPVGVLLSGTDLLVADSANHSLRKIAADGTVSTMGGIAFKPGSSEGTGFAASFNSPDGIAVTSGGTVYVVDSANYVVRRIVGSTVSTFAGVKGVSANNDGAAGVGRFRAPSDIAVRSDGALVVADSNSIRVVATDGGLTTLAGAVDTVGSTDASGTAARFRAPKGVAVDSTGNIYVADTGNCTIRKVDTAGIVTTVAGTAASCLVTDGTGAAARFVKPSAIAVDGSGNLYVADVGADGGSVIRKVTSAGVVTTLAGQIDQPGRANGTGTAARFGEIGGLAFFSDGSLMVADYGTGTIRKVTTGGAVTTVIGGDSQVGERTGATAPLPGQAKGIAVLGSVLYWTTDHAVMKAQ